MPPAVPDEITATPATRREWLGLAVLMLPTVLLALDMTVLHLAAPHLSADLQPTSDQLLWILDIYASTDAVHDAISRPLPAGRRPGARSAPCSDARRRGEAFGGLRDRRVG